MSPPRRPMGAAGARRGGTGTPAATRSGCVAGWLNRPPTTVGSCTGSSRHTAASRRWSRSPGRRSWGRCGPAPVQTRPRARRPAARGLQTRPWFAGATPSTHRGCGSCSTLLRLSFCAAGYGGRCSRACGCGRPWRSSAPGDHRPTVSRWRGCLAQNWRVPESTSSPAWRWGSTPRRMSGRWKASASPWATTRRAASRSFSPECWGPVSGWPCHGPTRACSRPSPGAACCSRSTAGCCRRSRGGFPPATA